mgnify:FL=1|jgi:hypothetical protein|tara:strand:- start:3208 stop:3981 length:774 start_codon:yes stop_codon:yes gene_type:complete
MKNETDIAVRNTAGALSSNLFEADANKGAQNIQQDDLALPFLKVLGHLSPEINKQHAKYIEGAQTGMIINSVTKELFKGEEGIDVLPVFYKRQYIEWQDRGASMGAPVNIYEASDTLPKTQRSKDNKDRLANGNYLETTASHFVILLGKTPTTALISMKATQLKVSRTWNSLMMGIKLQGKNGLFTPPTYSHIYNLKAVQMSNDKGTWFGWDVSLKGPVQNKAIYEVAKTFSERVNKGEVETKPEVREEPKQKTFNL